MEKKQQKILLNTLGSILIGTGVIWGALGFKIRHAPYLIVIIAAGCLCSYLGKRIDAR